MEDIVDILSDKNEKLRQQNKRLRQANQKLREEIELMRKLWPDYTVFFTNLAKMALPANRKPSLPSKVEVSF